MTIGEELTALRNRFAGCSVVAFADLSTGMVLAADTAQKTTQEKLDALCAAGRGALLGGTPCALNSVLNSSADKAPHSAIVANQNGVQCFIRAADPEHEALCFVLADASALERLIVEASDFLKQFSSETP